MKIKEKLTLGIIFLFVEFLVIALFGAYSIYNISQQSERIKPSTEHWQDCA